MECCFVGVQTDVWNVVFTQVIHHKDVPYRPVSFTQTVYTLVNFSHSITDPIEMYCNTWLYVQKCLHKLYINFCHQALVYQESNVRIFGSHKI